MKAMASNSLMGFNRRHLETLVGGTGPPPQR